jgi:hypothetical protein
MELSVEGWPLIIAIPEALREKLGSEGARALAELLNEAGVQTRGDVIEIAASRFERQLAEQIGGLRAEMHELVEGLRAELHSEIGALRAEMHELVEGLRAELHSEIGALRAEMHELVEGLRAEMHSLIGALRGEMHSLVGGAQAETHSELGSLRSEIREFEARITRWMFVFWIGQIGALLGILFAFFRT